MPIPAPRFVSRLAGATLALMALVLALPSAAIAQYGAPELSSEAIGEKYHVEVSGTLWNPDVLGVVSSAQFGVIGTKIDFVNDLGFVKTRFKDMRIVLRPSKKSKLRAQYTPVSYVGQTVLKRELLFNGQKFPVSVPLHSEFDWKVWRFTYEYDAFYRPRGFVGILIEARYPKMTASLTAPVGAESTKQSGVLPAFGLVGRGYVLPGLAINFEVSGFKLPKKAIKNIEANYFDWDIGGTVNVNNNVGLQLGWRRMSMYLSQKTDVGDVRFQGLWMGATLRY